MTQLSQTLSSTYLVNPLIEVRSTGHRSGLFWSGFVCSSFFGLVLFALVCSGLFWSVFVCSGMIYFCLVLFALVWFLLVWFGLLWSALVSFGLVLFGLVCCCFFWSGFVCSGLAWLILVFTKALGGRELMLPVSF